MAIPEQLLIVTKGNILEYKNRLTFKAPPGSIVGAIVTKRDWEDENFDIIQGEAVWVNREANEVRFVNEILGMICTIFKQKEYLQVAATVGGPKGTTVTWLPREEQNKAAEEGTET